MGVGELEDISSSQAMGTGKARNVGRSVAAAAAQRGRCGETPLPPPPHVAADSSAVAEGG